MSRFPAEFLERLEAAVLARNGRPVSGDEVQFQCLRPEQHQHGDIRSSARFNHAKAVWHCPVCGDGGGAIELARRLAVALPPPETPHGASSMVLETRFTLRDAAGHVVAHHIRRDYSDGSKDFAWSLSDGTPGLAGLKVADLPLYGVHDLADAVRGTTVVVVEGEKARDALSARGIVAVGTVTGASVTPSAATLSVVGTFDVVLWPDRDDPGRAHMCGIATALVAQGVSVRWLTWAAASPKGDAADYDGDTEGVRALIDAAPALPASDVGGDEASQNDSAAPKGSGAAERMLRFRTAREIAQETPGAVPWAVSGLLAFGAVTELAGKIKLSGKTTFGTQLAAAIVQGRPFLSQPTARSPVVWLTEQPPASFREALRRADLLDRDDFIVLSHHDTIGTAWPTVVAAAVAEANRRGARVLVVDTLPQFAGIRGDSENASGDALGAIEPLLAAAGQHGLAVLVIRHERKSGGDVGEATRGSTAFGGAVDILLLLRRVDGAPSKTFRVLQGIGRFDETPEELMIELTETGYVPRGSRDEVKRQVLREAVLGALPESGDSGLRPTEADILKRLGEGFHRTGVQAALKSLVAAGVVQRTGAGKKNDPYRYHRAESGEPPASDPEGSEPPPCPPAPEIHSAGQEPLGRQQQSPRLSSPEERPELDASNDLLATLRDSLAPDERYRLEAERADGFPAATFVLGAVAKDAR